MTKKEGKKDSYKMKTKIKNLEKDITMAINNLNDNENNKMHEEIAFLLNELTHLNKKNNE